jgi:hypothetical protein
LEIIQKQESEILILNENLEEFKNSNKDSSEYEIVIIQLQTKIQKQSEEYENSKEELQNEIN